MWTAEVILTITTLTSLFHYVGLCAITSVFRYLPLRYLYHGYVTYRFCQGRYVQKPCLWMWMAVVIWTTTTFTSFSQYVGHTLSTVTRTLRFLPLEVRTFSAVVVCTCWKKKVSLSYFYLSSYFNQLLGRKSFFFILIF